MVECSDAIVLHSGAIIESAWSLWRDVDGPTTIRMNCCHLYLGDPIGKPLSNPLKCPPIINMATNGQIGFIVIIISDSFVPDNNSTTAGADEAGQTRYRAVGGWE